MWVRSEYAGELAVLSTWLCGIAPWAVTWLSEGPLTGVFFWFIPGNFLFTPTIELPGSRPFWVWKLPAFFETRAEVLASYAWLVAAAIFLVAFVYSLVYYFDEERVESWRFDPVRVLGVFLLATGILFTIAWSFLWRNHPGLTIPVGTFFQLLFGVTLLKTERIYPDEDGGDSETTES
jgi:uncharacterized protein (TIGR04206 family)